MNKSHNFESGVNCNLYYAFRNLAFTEIETSRYIIMKCFCLVRLNFQSITNQADIPLIYSKIPSNILQFTNHFSFEFEKTINSMKSDEPEGSLTILILFSGYY